MLVGIKETRDYSLVGDAENITALDDDLIEERVEEAWWRPDIPRETLKSLMQRSNGAALWDFGFWMLLLAGSGYLAYLSWGSWWAVPAFIIYGTIYSSSDARWHECGHGTPFRTQWLNNWLYHLASFMTMREAILWRWSHARHHTYTIFVRQDAEIQVKRPADLFVILLDFIYLIGGAQALWGIVKVAFGRLDSDVRVIVPQAERPKMIWSSRVYVAVIAGCAVWSVAIGSFLPSMFVALPRFYGGWLHQLLGLTQHAGLDENTTDHRKNTRTVHINPVFRYLYLNMNYHLEHHIFPMVPYHALPRLHEVMKAQTPPPYRSLWEVYREMVPALIKNATVDPDYHIERAVPAPRLMSEQAPEAATTVVSGQWVEIPQISDLAEDDVMRFDHNGLTFAVYRLKGNEYHATDGLCTHGRAHLADGLVMNGVIECPKHNGRFEIPTGKAIRRPACIDLKTYPVEHRDGKVYLQISRS